MWHDTCMQPRHAQKQLTTSLPTTTPYLHLACTSRPVGQWLDGFNWYVQPQPCAFIVCASPRLALGMQDVHSADAEAFFTFYSTTNSHLLQLVCLPHMVVSMW